MSRQRRRKPNILLVVLDCARADHCSVYGHGRPTTPVLERLAAEGTVFEQAISPAGWSLPAHASLFTGLFPSRHGADDQHQYLDGDVPTVPLTLAKEGYRTIGICGNPWVSRETGLVRGFQHVDTLMPIQPGHGSRVRQAASRAMRKARLFAENGGDVSGDWATIKANQWLRRLRAQTQPFFMFVHFNEPHTPHELPLRHRTRFTSDLADKRTVAAVTQDVNEIIAGAVTWDDHDFRLYSAMYDAGIAYADARVGNIVATLRDLNLLDDTLIAVTADHGEALGEHGLLGHKCDLYESLIHVPLVVRFPNAFSPGSREPRLVQTLDLAPTILDLAGIDRPGEPYAIQGRSLLGTDGPHMFAVAEQAVPRFDMFPARFPYFDPAPHERELKAIRRGTWKYIWSSDGRHELYNLDDDPGEQRNLAASCAGTAGELHHLLFEWFGTAEPRTTGVQAIFDDTVSERLRDLGYIP
ncbi:MAG: sulfatase [Nitrolancea sp.]